MRDISSRIRPMSVAEAVRVNRILALRRRETAAVLRSIKPRTEAGAKTLRECIAIADQIVALGIILV